MAKEIGLDFLETELKGKNKLGKGRKSGGGGQTALRDQRRARVANRSINQTTLGRLQRRRRNRINGKQGHEKKKNAKREVERIKMLRGSALCIGNTHLWARKRASITLP